MVFFNIRLIFEQKISFEAGGIPVKRGEGNLQYRPYNIDEAWEGVQCFSRGHYPYSTLLWGPAVDLYNWNGCLLCCFFSDG